MLSTTLYFILALLLLVTVHEYGHFQVARWCGVKVLRFSFGFGKILFSWHDKKGTEYAWSLFPLGGYVKMLDENEGDVAPEEKHLAFNNQSLLVRTAIVLAGPLFNFLFAFVALWLVSVIGIYSLAPIVETVIPHSVADKAGLTAKQEITGLNDQKINSWRDFQYALMPMIGSDETIVLQVKSTVTGQQQTIHLPLAEWKLDSKKPDPLKSLGIEPFIPHIPPIIGEVTPDLPGDKAGLQANDKIVLVDGIFLNDWLFLVDYVKAHPNQELTLEIKRKGQLQEVKVKTGQQDNQGTMEGFIGVRSQ
ncbi:MAG: RIP metalloprotease RseP, partial [Legionella sp.]